MGPSARAAAASRPGSSHGEHYAARAPRSSGRIDGRAVGTPGQGLTRRTLLRRAGYGAGSIALASQLGLVRAAAGAPRRAVPLPTPARVRTDVQRMVDFGPRLTGNAAHNRFVAWLERQLEAAGCELLPCDVYDTSRWEVGTFGLDVLEGLGAGPAKVATYFPRSKERPPAGVTGPLVYGGVLPQPSVNGTDAGALQAGPARFPADLAAWAQAVPGTLAGSPRGSILLVDLPAPLPATAGALAPLVTYYNGQGETEADLIAADYKRLWLHPGLVMPLGEFAAMGVAGVFLILDASYEALKGQYLPFEWQNEDIPALYVDRDTGAKLRELAGGRPKTRLTLTATRKTVPSPTVTAVLPGASKETLIFNTHTDGQGFVEENGPVAFVQLARHFASLPRDKRLKRTLVFANWPGHMSNDLPQAQGWIDAHKGLVDRAAAALTVEHLGCSEWIDSPDKGYHATGRSELFAVWTSQGPMFDTVRDVTVEHDLPRTALLRPPAQFGVGGPFQTAGIPQIGAIAGPEYLLRVNDTGDMDKLDAALAARQIAWLADLATRLDPVPAAELRQGDPTLGGPAPKGNVEPSDAQPKPTRCGPDATFAVAAGAGRSLSVRYYGRRHAVRGVLVILSARGGALRSVTVELRRGRHLVARARAAEVGESPRRVVLRAAHGSRIRRGHYTLVLRGA